MTLLKPISVLSSLLIKKMYNSVFSTVTDYFPWVGWGLIWSENAAIVTADIFRSGIWWTLYPKPRPRLFHLQTQQSWCPYFCQFTLQKNQAQKFNFEFSFSLTSSYHWVKNKYRIFFTCASGMQNARNIEVHENYSLLVAVIKILREYCETPKDRKLNTPLVTVRNA